MRLKHWIVLGNAVLLPSCMVYDSDLLNDAVGGDGDIDGGSGGTGSGGKGSGGDSDGPSGGVGADGGDPGDGDGDGDGDGESGGTSSGGRASGGADSGGAPSTGGAGTGGNGAGGSPPVCSAATAPCVVDDLEHVDNASYFSDPFRGKWDRYIQLGGSFTADSVADMVVEADDDPDNGSFHIAATDLDDWGLGVFLTIKSGSYQDISGYKGIRFRARSTNEETVINVALADEASHQPACSSVDDGADCDKHMRSAQAPTVSLDSDWTTVSLALSGFVDDAVAEEPRAAALNLKKVYAIHFQVQTTVGTEADFYIDDIEMY